MALALPLPVAAGETDTFGITPHPIEVDGKNRRTFKFGIAEGGAVRDAVLLFNKTREPIQIKLAVLDAERDPNGTIRLGEGKAPTGVGARIRVNESLVRLGPSERKVIGFSVSRQPGDAPGLGAIIAEQVGGAEPGEGSSIDLVTRVAITVEVSDGSSDPTFQIDAVRLHVPLQLFPSHGHVSAVIFNGTASTVTAQLRASVKGLTGRTYPFIPRDVVLNPGESKTVRLPWTSVPGLGGLMRATVSVARPEGAISLSSPRTPVLPLWLLALLIVGEAVYLVRRRSRKGRFHG